MKRAALLALAALTTAGCMAFHRGAMPGEPKGASWLEVEGTRVRYVDVGEGPPVVLLHGFASSLEVWSEVLPRLVEGRRVLALDLKGFGWTDRPEGDYGPEAQAALVLALMDARGIDRAAVVAHSWGSSVALALAAAAPERVSRLALYDAWVYEAQLPPFFLWARAPLLGEVLFRLFYEERPEDRLVLAYYDPERVTQPLVDAVERALDRPGTLAATLAAVRGQRFEALQAGYREVRAPVLLLWGREDAVTPLAWGERLARDLPDARLVVFPRCGHLPMIEAASASTTELLRFLEAER